MGLALAAVLLLGSAAAAHAFESANVKGRATIESTTHQTYGTWLVRVRLVLTNLQNGPRPRDLGVPVAVSQR